jgi:hypothetical protein
LNEGRTMWIDLRMIDARTSLAFLSVAAALVLRTAPRKNVTARANSRDRDGAPRRGPARAVARRASYAPGGVSCPAATAAGACPPLAKVEPSNRLP